MSVVVRPKSGQRGQATWMQNMGTAEDRRCLPRLLRVSTIAQRRGCAPGLLYFAAVPPSRHRKYPGWPKVLMVVDVRLYPPHVPGGHMMMGKADQPMKSTIITISAAAAIVVLALAGCGSLPSHPAAAPTVTHTVIQSQTAAPAPTVTITQSQTAAPAPTVTITQSQTPTIPSQPSAGSGANQVIVRLGGTGTQNTQTFTTPSNWHLSWSYWGCPGSTSNFIVSEYNADGSMDLNGISVNELGTGRGPVATYGYGDAGTHYLSVNTEGCSWSLVPVTG